MPMCQLTFKLPEEQRRMQVALKGEELLLAVRELKTYLVVRTGKEPDQSPMREAFEDVRRCLDDILSVRGLATEFFPADVPLPTE